MGMQATWIHDVTWEGMLRFDRKFVTIDVKVRRRKKVRGITAVNDSAVGGYGDTARTPSPHPPGSLPGGSLTIRFAITVILCGMTRP